MPPGTRSCTARRSPLGWVCTRGGWWWAVTVTSPRRLWWSAGTPHRAPCTRALADPGTLPVSDTTLRLLRSTVCSTAYGLVRVPGHTDPLIAYTVQGLETPTATRVWSPFVGRRRSWRSSPPSPHPGGAGAGGGSDRGAGHREITALVACWQRLPERPVTVLRAIAGPMILSPLWTCT